MNPPTEVFRPQVSSPTDASIPPPATSFEDVDTSTEETDARERPAVLEEVVIEEISIDGMCGVY
jgi:mycofactocin precursor